MTLILHLLKKNLSNTTVFSTDDNIMLSEGSCYTEDWGNGC